MKMGKRTGVIAAAAVLAVLVAAAVLYFVPVLKVQTIAIEGNAAVAPEEIQAAAQVPTGTNLLRVNESEVASRVAGVPWVSKVSVSRRLPTTLSVKIDERKPLLYTKRNDGEHLIDETAVPFVIDIPPPGVVELTGTREDDPAVLRPAVKILNSLDSDTRSKLERMDAKSAYEFTLYFAGGKEVYWGSEDLSHDKSVATKTVLQREGNRWNVSSPGLVTVRK